MTMSQVKSPPFTIHDYRKMPDDGHYYQVIEGELYMSPAPSNFHQIIVGNIYFIFRSFLQVNPIGQVRVSPFDVYLTPNTVVQPDVLYVSKENAAIIIDAGVEGAPDLVVEILSPGTRALDLGPKRAIYARTGVKELRIVDPIALTIQVYRLQINAELPEAAYNATATFTSPLLPGLTISTAEIFQQ